jgi:hypothetical protein
VIAGGGGAPPVGSAPSGTNAFDVPTTSRHAKGAARDLSVVLSSDRQSLVLTLTPNENDVFSSDVTYTIYWLDPNVFSEQDIYGQNGTVLPGLGLSLIQARQKVIDIQGGSGIVFAAVSYLPYVTGGWMYATVVPSGSTKEYRLSGTNFVHVPLLGAAGEPLVAEIPSNLGVTTKTISGSNRLVQFTWRNAAVLSTVAFIKITAVNYWFDGFQRDIAIFRVNTSPGTQQGFQPLNFSLVDNSQSVVLEADSSAGAHTINWYFVPMSQALTPLHLTACPVYNTGAIA